MKQLNEATTKLRREASDRLYGDMTALHREIILKIRRNNHKNRLHSILMELGLRINSTLITEYDLDVDMEEMKRIIR